MYLVDTGSVAVVIALRDTADYTKRMSILLVRYMQMKKRDRRRKAAEEGKQRKKERSTISQSKR